MSGGSIAGRAVFGPRRVTRYVAVTSASREEVVRVGEASVGAMRSMDTAQRGGQFQPTGPEYNNGYQLAARDVARARTGAIVYMPEWLYSAGHNYLEGYLAGVPAAGGHATVDWTKVPGEARYRITAGKTVYLESGSIAPDDFHPAHQVAPGHGHIHVGEAADGTLLIDGMDANAPPPPPPAQADDGTLAAKMVHYTLGDAYPYAVAGSTVIGGIAGYVFGGPLAVILGFLGGNLAGRLGAHEAQKMAAPACPVPRTEMQSTAGPLMMALMSDEAPKVAPANISAARSIVRRAEACGQSADADIVRSAIFAVTKDPADKPHGPVPGPGE